MMVIDHAARFEDHQLLSEVQCGHRAHCRFQLVAEVLLRSLLVADGDVVSCREIG